MKLREAVRIVAVSNGKIGLVYSTRKNYYSLPGGGIHKKVDTTIESAAVREYLEETGCSITHIKRIGVIEEVSVSEKIINKTYGIFANISEHNSQLLDEDEKAEELKFILVPIQDAITAIETSQKISGEAFYLFFERDLSLIRLCLELKLIH